MADAIRELEHKKKLQTIHKTFKTDFLNAVNIMKKEGIGKPSDIQCLKRDLKLHNAEISDTIKEFFEDAMGLQHGAENLHSLPGFKSVKKNTVGIEFTFWRPPEDIISQLDNYIKTYLSDFFTYIFSKKSTYLDGGTQVFYYTRNNDPV